jgi:hypothetical protein
MAKSPPRRAQAARRWSGANLIDLRLSPSDKRWGRAASPGASPPRLWCRSCATQLARRSRMAHRPPEQELPRRDALAGSDQSSDVLRSFATVDGRKNVLWPGGFSTSCESDVRS